MNEKTLECEVACELSNDEYHKLPAVSHSSLECFRRSKRAFKAQYIDKTLKREQTPAMLLGSLVHAMTFEPQKVDSLYVLAPKFDRRTTVGKAGHAEFQASVGDREGVDADTWAKAVAISESVMTNKTARLLLDCQAEKESPMFWTCPTTGIECRSKADFRSVFGMPYMLDLKTCQDATPSAFASSSARYGYGRQAAWYLWGHEENGLGNCRFIFIAVATNEPYEVGLYELSDHDIIRARMQNKVDLEEFARCRATGNWEALHERDIVNLQLPKWVDYEDQYQVY